MKGLPKSELQDGHVYYCLLAQRPVLFQKERLVIHEVDGYNSTDFIFDGQLVEYKMPREKSIELSPHEKVAIYPPPAKKPTAMYPVKQVLDKLNDKDVPL